MLTALLNLPWATDERAFADPIVDWDNNIARYEMPSGKQFADDYRIARPLVHAPEPHKTILRQAPPSAKTSHVALRQHLREWQASGRTFDAMGTANASGIAPMDVSAVSGHKAMKGQGRQEQGQASQGQSDKTKGKEPRFEGTCNHCQKPGHRPQIAGARPAATRQHRSRRSRRQGLKRQGWQAEPPTYSISWETKRPAPRTWRS